MQPEGPGDFEEDHRRGLEDDNSVFSACHAEALAKEGVLLPPVRSLLWDGEHRFRHQVCPEKLRPTKAWEIHPIKLLAER